MLLHHFQVGLQGSAALMVCRIWIRCPGGDAHGVEAPDHVLDGDPPGDHGEGFLLLGDVDLRARGHDGLPRRDPYATPRPASTTPPVPRGAKGRGWEAYSSRIWKLRFPWATAMVEILTFSP